MSIEIVSHRDKENRCRLALSQNETILLSSSGDVLVAREAAPQIAVHSEDITKVCCDDIQEAAMCSPWTTATQGGLMGGATTATEETFQTRAHKAFQTMPLVDTGFDNDEESIVPIKSFDYSHFQDGGNDMLPPPKLTQQQQQQHFSGIPTFHPAFVQICVTTVSAHPLGSHVLLISNAGLLYSYGLNTYGQLGIGLYNNKQQQHSVNVPTIVTPLVEHGGKAIACAAGVNHSLVVVSTDEGRLLKNNSDSTININTMVHHQLYGFGRNDYKKLGLLSNEKDDHVLLPRRVALRAKVRPASSSSPEPAGIFAVEASAEHSAALVRRANGDVELYTWGNAMHGALGVGPVIHNETDASSIAENGTGAATVIGVVPTPTFVAAMSKTTRGESLMNPTEFPTTVSLGYRCSFVTTSQGRCFSFGVSEHGMLGLGRKVHECLNPTEISLPNELRNEHLVSVRAGAASVVATTQSGQVLAWGMKSHVGLAAAMEEKAPQVLSTVSGSWEERSSQRNEDPIQWYPKLLTFPQDESVVVEATAGYDNAVFVTDAGRVLSCGTGSGRLGLGAMESSTVVTQPRPLFGGLQLWRKRNNSKTTIRYPSLPRPRPRLVRGKSVV